MVIVHKFTLVKKYRPKERKVAIAAYYKIQSLTPRFLYFETDDFETKNVWEFLDYRSNYHVISDADNTHEIKI